MILLKMWLIAFVTFVIYVLVSLTIKKVMDFVYRVRIIELENRVASLEINSLNRRLDTVTKTVGRLRDEYHAGVKCKCGVKLPKPYFINKEGLPVCGKCRHFQPEGTYNGEDGRCITEGKLISKNDSALECKHFEGAE